MPNRVREREREREGWKERDMEGQRDSRLDEGLLERCCVVATVIKHQQIGSGSRGDGGGRAQTAARLQMAPASK